MKAEGLGIFRRARLVCIMAAACLAGLVFDPPSGAVQQDAIAVIVNRGNQVEKLDESEVRRIYTDNVLMWPDRTPITVYDLTLQDTLRAAFSERIFGRPPYKIAEEWAHLKITNQAKNPPVTIKSQWLIIRRVSQEKGAIGYVSLSTVKGNPDVKVVLAFSPAER